MNLLLQSKLLSALLLLAQKGMVEECRKVEPKLRHHRKQPTYEIPSFLRSDVGRVLKWLGLDVVDQLNNIGGRVGRKAGQQLIQNSTHGPQICLGIISLSMKNLLHAHI